MNAFDEEIKELDEHFKSVQQLAIQEGKENWDFLEKMIKEGNRNNAWQVLEAAKTIVAENAKFADEKRKYHLVRNAMQKGFNLAVKVSDGS